MILEIALGILLAVGILLVIAVILYIVWIIYDISQDDKRYKKEKDQFKQELDIVKSSFSKDSNLLNLAEDRDRFNEYVDWVEDQHFIRDEINLFHDLKNGNKDIAKFDEYHFRYIKNEEIKKLFSK